MTVTDTGFIVLVAVDDEALNNELMERVFHGRAKWKLQTYKSGEAALERLNGEGVDLLLVDHSMPGISGVELLRELRSRGNQTPAVVVTAFPESPEVIEAFNSGLARYIVAKPWRSADLIRTIERALSRKPSAPQA